MALHQLRDVSFPLITLGGFLEIETWTLNKLQNQRIFLEATLFRTIGKSFADLNLRHLSITNRASERRITEGISPNP